MNKDFCRIITLLRKEKKLSQKQVANDLDISQALLSHYEKGIRECGLDFLVKISDYYEVSTDYLLGRTPQRYSDITDINDEKNESKKITATQIVNKRIIQNTLGVLYDYLIKIGNRKLSNNVSNYLMLALYNMFRKIYSANAQNPQDMFAVNEEVYSGFCDSAMMITSTRVASATNINCKKDYITSSGELELSPEIIANEYPQIASSVFNLIQHAESNMRFKK